MKYQTESRSALGIDPGIANTGYAIMARTTGKFKVLESVFHNKNVSSSMKTAGVIGIMQLLAEHAQIRAELVTPQEVKAAVGIATADKQQMQRLIKKLTGENTTTHHTADAIAAGIAGLLKM